MCLHFFICEILTVPIYIGLLEGINELIYVKHLELCLEFSKHYERVSKYYFDSIAMFMFIVSAQ